jgi:mono/diheme cytochrome c family protein
MNQMKRTRILIALLLMFAGWCAATLRDNTGFSPLRHAQAATPNFARDIRPLLEKHCFACHGGAEKPIGGVNLERFTTEADVLRDRNAWATVFEKVESHQMPPPKQKTQPTAAERELLLAWITAIAARPDPQLGARDPGKPVLRRLTRLEYNNTVRDLLGLTTDVFIFPERLPLLDKNYFQPAAGKLGDEVLAGVREYGEKYPVLLPQEGLPGDNRAEHGYRNRGDAMNFSPLQLEQYVALAGEIVNHPDLPKRSARFAELLGASSAPPRERLANFMKRAFRRPVPPAEVNRFFTLFETARQAGRSEADAMRAAAQAVLSSSGFLFLAEPVRAGAGSVRELDDFELASRLSYFLWASAPDDELLALAHAGRLRDAATLEAQTRRMLRDTKARELSESFAVQWLRLDQLYTAKPDAELFPIFYQGPQGKTTLHGALLIEALLLFETVLLEDRSVLDFVNANYTWLNPHLAKVYGVSPSLVAPPPVPVPGQSNSQKRLAAERVNNTWRRVTLDDPTRGGFLTMGGPLMITSLPFRTSPVKRGAWLLETIFNRPPQEPKVAFAIENDTKEAAQNLSVRQRFEAHRNKAACYSCHVRLDPPGFALERFNAIGQWRERDGGQAVDARGEWNGMAFDGPAGFKRALLKNPDEFTRGFIEHLLTYALGRKLALSDLTTVSEIQRAVQADGYRFSRVITEIIKSYPFRHTRNG